MHLYDPEFLFAFLPIFIGIYALLPAGKRPIAIAAANILFLYLAGKYELIGFLVTFASAYFSGISLYNLRNVPEKAQFRKNLLGTNIALYSMVFILLTVSETGGAGSALLSPSTLFFRAVIPLHLISYLFDVYRGDCPVQTRLSSLTAYAAFFPSASFGPVMKYKSFENSFKAPNMTAKKLAAGIRLYIFGLAEYLIIARRLEAVRSEIISAPDSLRGGTAWLFVPLYYVMFTVSVLGMLHMGRGVSLMLGFYVRPAARRTFFTDDFSTRLRQWNEPLASWLTDYIFKPIKQSSGRDSSALIFAVCVGTLWYNMTVGMLITGFAIAGLIALQSQLYKTRRSLGKITKGLITKVIVLVSVAVCAFMELPSAALKIFGSTSGSENAFFEHLLNETAIPFIIGLLLSGALLPQLIRRINLFWLKAMIPVVETILLVVSISFMLNVA